MFLALCFVIILLYIVYLKSRPKPFILPPCHPGYLPVIGHAHLLFGDSNDLWRTIKTICGKTRKLGGVVSFSISSFWTLYSLTDPEDCFTVANSCLQKGASYDMGKPWLGEGLITGSVPIWKMHRKLLSRAFSQTVLDEYMKVFNSQAKKIVTTLAKEVGGPPFDHLQYFEEISLETICLTTLGLDDEEDGIRKNEQYMTTVSELCNTIVQRFQAFWMQSNIIFYWTGLKRKQDRLIRVLHNLSHSVLKRKKDKLKLLNGEVESVRFQSFMDILLQDDALTDEEIREEVDTMIVAGAHTTANLLVNIILILGSRPEVQDRAYRELQEVLNDSKRDVEKDDLNKLIYLDAVIKETLRFRPVAPIIARQLDRDIKLKNCTLPSGSSCFLFLYAMHRHPAWGPDADQYKPERWLSPDTLPDNPNAFAGFSLGRRTCIDSHQATSKASVSNSAGSGAAAAAERERQDLMRIVKWTGSRKQRRGSGAIRR